MPRIRHRNRRGRGTVPANATPGTIIDFDLTDFFNETNRREEVEWEGEFDVTFASGETTKPIPFRINNDGLLDGNDTLVWTFEETATFGFSQDIYVFNEILDGPPDNNGFSANTEVQVTLQQPSSIKTAIIILEDAHPQALPPISGTASWDWLSGTEGMEAMYGATRVVTNGIVSFAPDSGNDVINGLEGDDSLYGFAGNDLLNGGAGDDFLIGQAGEDLLHGEIDNDSLLGLDGFDILYGGSGDDDLFGGTDNDVLYGGSGDDFLYGEAGTDSLYGGLGNDTYILEDALDTINELPEQGIDTVKAAFNYTLGNTLENLDLISINALVGIGNALNNVIVDRVVNADVNHTLDGGAGDDFIGAGRGDDQVNGGEGNDTLDGWEGNDTLNGGNGTDLLYGGDEVETLTGGANADTFAFIFIPFGSSNTITDFNWQEGDKLLVSASGFGLALNDYSDFSFNASSNTVFFNSTAVATLSGVTDFNPTRDIIIAQIDAQLDPVSKQPLPPQPPIDDSFDPTGLALVGTVNGEWLTGSEGLDTLTANAGDDVVHGLEEGDDLSGGDGNDLLNGGSGDDLVSGDAGNDQLFGEEGDDSLSGGAGNDWLRGGSGADLFQFYDPTQEGIDQILDFTVGEDAIAINITDPDSPFGSIDLPANTTIAPDQFHIGSAAADPNDYFIYDATTGAFFFDPDGTGATAQIQLATLTAGLSLSSSNIVTIDESGDDDPPIEEPPFGVGTPNRDTITGTPGDDDLFGLEGNDRLLGSGGNDDLLGGTEKDKLQGDAGKDRLFGGPGSDQLKGGKGRDVFVLEKGPGRDKILDFRDRQDKLGLSPGLKFKQLTITQQGKNTLISFKKDPLALLIGTDADQITGADFVKVRNIPIL